MCQRSVAEFLSHEVDERTQRGERGAVDLVVAYGEVETLFEEMDHGQHPHRVEFGHGPQKRALAPQGL